MLKSHVMKNELTGLDTYQHLVTEDSGYFMHHNISVLTLLIIKLKIQAWNCLTIISGVLVGS